VGPGGYGHKRDRRVVTVSLSLSDIRNLGARSPGPRMGGEAASVPHRALQAHVRNARIATYVRVCTTMSTMPDSA